MLESSTNICLQNRINYENKYLCAVCLYCQCRPRKTDSCTCGNPEKSWRSQHETRRQQDAECSVQHAEALPLRKTTDSVFIKPWGSDSKRPAAHQRCCLALFHIVSKGRFSWKEPKKHCFYILLATQRSSWGDIKNQSPFKFGYTSFRKIEIVLDFTKYTKIPL